jgi:predicted ABC-type ATPase
MKRMRVFAGPNGSGKTTLVDELILQYPGLINTNRHINPDNFDLTSGFDFGVFGLNVSF